MGGEVGGWMYLHVLDHAYMYARTHFQVSDRLAAISEMTIRDLPRVDGKCRRRSRAGMLVCGWLGAGEEPVQMWMQALSARALQAQSAQDCSGMPRQALQERSARYLRGQRVKLRRFERLLQ